REHVAVGRVDRDDGAARAGQHLAGRRVDARLGERPDGRELQLHVERRVDVVAGLGPLRLDAAQETDGLLRAVDRGIVEHAAARIAYLLAPPDLTVQDVLVGALEAGLADLRAARVLGAVDALEIGRADAADVADRVRGRLAVRVE